jgi:hypothetical protein
LLQNPRGAISVEQSTGNDWMTGFFLKELKIKKNFYDWRADHVARGKPRSLSFQLVDFSSAAGKYEIE